MRRTEHDRIARLAGVQAQPPGIRMDVAERIADEVQVALLEDVGAASRSPGRSSARRAGTSGSPGARSTCGVYRGRRWRGGTSDPAPYLDM